LLNLHLCHHSRRHYHQMSLAEGEKLALTLLLHSVYLELPSKQ